MNFVRTAVSTNRAGIREGDSPAALRGLLEPGCAAAIWHRQVPQDVRTWLDGLAPEKLPCGRVAVAPERVGDAARLLCEMADTPRGRERDWLLSDIANLASLFAQMMPAPFLRLRLGVVTSNACRKFHMDAITARLLCTYRGTGTQYGLSGDGADPLPVHTVPTGAPVVLRGSLSPGAKASGVLHRSPPIEGTGETRLVLVLDPIDDPEADA